MRNDIMGVLFDNLTLAEAVDAGERLAAGPGFAYVVTPNPEIVNLARQREDYRQVLNGAGLVLPDGIGVIHAAKILGTPLQERVPGIDFASGLLMFFGGQAMATPVVLVGMLLMGIVYGSGITLSATMIRQLYGNTHYAQNFSVCNLCTFPAAIIGPMLSAALIQAAGGGYQTTFLMVIILGALTLVMNFFIRKP